MDPPLQLVLKSPPPVPLSDKTQGVYSETYANLQPRVVEPPPAELTWLELSEAEIPEDDIDPAPCAVGRVSTDARAIPVTLRTRSLCMQCLRDVTPVRQNCCPNCNCVDTVIPADCPLAREMLACPRDPSDGHLLLTHELNFAVGQEMIITSNQRMNPHVHFTPAEINRH